MGNLEEYGVGDRVTYELKGLKYVTLIENDGLFLDPSVKILKIERPIYEVVAEVNEEEEKEELLTEDEKNYLREVLDSDLLKDKNITKILINKMFSGMSSCEYAIVEFRSEERTELTINNYFHRFEELNDCENYTLEELGLKE